ncbi:MAG: lamin tail domain-containing protein [Lewinellaceae bacterium]|nr:lamin tail domain-containing protein [Lewinellaceae bacterium]
MEKKSFFALLLALSVHQLAAQLQDGFSDGDFTSNPAWFGDTDKFTVTDGELQLLDNSPGAGNTAYLYLPAPTSTGDDTRWEAYVRLEFSPSASNFARIYLSASNADLSGPQEGYYLKIGGISGSDDAVELYRQDGDAATLLLSGTVGAAGTDPVVARLQVNRSADGEWELLADYSGGTSLQPEGTATDNTYPMGAFFGVYCQYTSTRNDVFFFDDILVDPLFQDTEPPLLLGAEAISATEVIARFDEPLGETSASQTGNYGLDNGIGQPAEALFDEMAPDEVRLLFDTPLQNTQSYTLTVTGIRDTAGNAAPPQSQVFTFYDIQPAAFGDVIISEIFPDPTPSVGLPDAEYVELYNRSDKVIQLSGLAISSGSTPAPLPDYLLLPGAYVTVCDDSYEAAFSTFGPAVSVGTFPALTNNGDEIRLSSTDGELIFEVFYDAGWYQDESKADGGYSLELIRLQGPYGCPGNWRASAAAQGGTPGQPNSLLGTSPDEEAPALALAVADSESELRLAFSEVMDEASLSNPGHYTLTPPLLITAAIPQPGNTEVVLVLDGVLQPGTAYQIGASEAVTDCMGNPLPPGASIITGLAEPIEPLDLIINEVLFNPDVGGSDFIELYNRSAKTVNLNGLAIANTQKESGDTLGSVSRDFLLFPGEYIVLTEQPGDISTRFSVPSPQYLLEAALPSLDDEGGNVTIRNAGVPIAAITYDESWYRAETPSNGGFSIELIQPEGPYDCPGNWRASAAAQGGTPGRPNSLLGTTPDQAPPFLAKAIAESEFELRLTFSEVMDEATLSNPGHYTLSPPLPAIAAIPQPGRTEILLVLDGTLQPGAAYQLQVSEAVTDCMGNPLPPGTAVATGLAEPIDSLDIVINEVLFNPEPNGFDFIELYNRSAKVANLNGLAIANTQKETRDSLGEVTEDFLLFPGAYAVLTEAPDDIASRFSVRFPRALLEAGLPALDDKNGNVSLRLGGRVIDAFDYAESLHYPLLDSKEGVSLERISPEAPTQDGGNWHSAASTVGFATPTYENSQFFDKPGVLDEMFTILTPTFSPDGDGFDDVLLIDYETEQPGYTLNLHIYDSSGRLARRLANNETLPARGSLKWDGTGEDGSRARIGIYVVWFEVFLPDGQVERDKKVVVLAGRLE